MISPGLRVRVVVPEGCRDPWICQKDGWRGDVAAAADDIGPGFWRVRFAPPWCELGILRVMPGDALVVVEDSTAAKVNPIKGMGVGAWVKVKDNAGSSDGEEHIRRRRGQVGHVIAEGVEARGFRYVAFPGAPLCVLIQAAALVPVTAQPKVKTIIRQLGLPMM